MNAGRGQGRCPCTVFFIPVRAFAPSTQLQELHSGSSYVKTFTYQLTAVHTEEFQPSSALFCS